MLKTRFLMPIVCLLAALGIFSTALYLPSLPAIGYALSASQESVQLTLAVFFLGSALGSLLLGPLSDRLGRILVAKGGLILFILASFWCAESQSIFSLQMARFLQGFAASAGPLVARAIGRDLYEGSHFTRFSATIMMVISVSPAIAPTLGGIIESHFGWEKNFYFLMVFGILLGLMVWIWLPETNGHRRNSPEPFSVVKGYISLFENPAYGVLCLIIGLQMSAAFFYITLSPYLFISFFGWSAQSYGYVGIATAFGNTVGFALSRHLAHRWRLNKGVLSGTFLCFVVSLVFVGFCLAFPMKPQFVIVYMICFFCAQALAVADSSAAAMHFFPHRAGTAAAMVGAVQIGAGACGSALASLSPVSPIALGSTLGGISLISLSLGLWLEKKKWLGR